MDDELKRYLEAMEGRLMAAINDTSEKLIVRLTSLERDFQNTKEFLISDALVAGRRWLDLESRVNGLERKS